jgi:hypothetical protein
MGELIFMNKVHVSIVKLGSAQSTSNKIINKIIIMVSEGAEKHD